MSARHGQARQATLDLGSPLLRGRIRVRAPEPGAPFWRQEVGTRHSYGSLRCGLDPGSASALGEAHLEAIYHVASAALEASRRGDSRETARLALAAGRLCEEIAGRSPPTAVEVPRH